MSSRWLKGGIAIHRRWALGLASETAANRCYRLVAAWKPPRARNGQPVLCRLGQHRGAARAFFRQGPMEWDKLSSWAWRVVDRARQRGKMQRGIEADLLLLLFTGIATQHPMPSRRTLPQRVCLATDCRVRRPRWEPDETNRRRTCASRPRPPEETAEIGDWGG